jgi:hypothetical protein
MLGYSAISSEPIGVSSATVTSVISVTVTPSSANISGGDTLNFTATVNGTGSPPQSVIWAVVGGGSITNVGVLTGPAAISSAQILTVTATSTFDGSKVGSATVTVAAAGTPPPAYGRKFKMRISRIHGFSGFSRW